MISNRTVEGVRIRFSNERFCGNTMAETENTKQNRLLCYRHFKFLSYYRKAKVISIYPVNICTLDSAQFPRNSLPDVSFSKRYS